MQENLSVMVVRWKLKIPSLDMPNSYPRDGIFNPHLKTIKDTYMLSNEILRFLNEIEIDLTTGGH